MRHISTVAESEGAMRKRYPRSDGESVTAREEHLLAVERLIKLSRQKDMLELEMSKAKATIMEFMQTHSAMVNEAGNVLVEWKTGSGRKKVDVDALVELYHISDTDLENHTSVSAGARTFSVTDTACDLFDSSGGSCGPEDASAVAGMANAVPIEEMTV